MADDPEDDLNPYALGDEDGASAAIAKAMEELEFDADGDQEEPGGLAVPMKAADDEIVRADETETAADKVEREESSSEYETADEGDPAEDDPEDGTSGDDGAEKPDERPAYLSGLSDDDATAIAATGDRAESIAERVKWADDMSRIAAPFVRDYEKVGLSPADAFVGLSRINAFANSDPAGYMRWFADKSGIKPGDVMKAFGGEAEPDDFDPFAEEPDEKPAPATRAAPGFDPQQPTAQEANAMLEQWVGAKDGEGNLVRPHVDRVGDRMAGTIQQARARGVAITPAMLDKAYEEAMWATPELRDDMLAARDAKAGAEVKAIAAREQVDTAKKSGARARRASRTIKAGSQGGRAKSSALDPNDDLNGYLDQQLRDMGI